MTIQPIGPISVALFLTPDDLRVHGLTPQELTRDVALELSRGAFLEAGLPADGPMEIEAYPDPCGVLVFARIRAPERVWLSFEDCEDLILAARALPEPCPEAALTWCDGKWWLSLPAREEHLAGFLSEFGHTERDCPHLDARLAEHGKPVLPHDALSALLRHFPAV